MPGLGFSLLLVLVVVASRMPESVRTLSPGRHPRDVSDLGSMLDEFVGDLPAAGPYRAPTLPERTRFLTGFDTLAAGYLPDAVEQLRPVGFTVRAGSDPVTGRRFGLASNEPHSYRSWGEYLVDLSNPTALVVEVPHPANDVHTHQLGLELFRAVPGVLLAVSGTNRYAAAGAGDVAHQTDSLFHAVAAEAATRGLPQIQLHGFHDATLPDADVVISPGAGPVTDPVRQVADRLADAGFAVCRSWVDRCGQLEGTRNEQGKDAAARHTVFVHVELSRSVRDDPTRWGALAAALTSLH